MKILFHSGLRKMVFSERKLFLLLLTIASSKASEVAVGSNADPIDALMQKLQDVLEPSNGKPCELSIFEKGAYINHMDLSHVLCCHGSVEAFNLVRV